MAMMGTVRIATDEASGAATVRIGRGGATTVIAEVCGRGFILEAADTQDRRVGSWGRLLATLCELPGVTGAQVLHRTVQGTGDADGPGLRAWWAGQAGGASAWADRVVAEFGLMEDLRDRARVIRLHALENLDRLLARFSDQLEAAGGQVHWAGDAAEAREIVAGILETSGARW